MKVATWIASGLSTMWFGLFLFLICTNDPGTPALTLNEWGDFIAGFAAPLAFVWLVAGYHQQGQELRLNTEALLAQQEELRQQVEATRSLALQADRQAKAAEEMALIRRKERADEDEVSLRQTAVALSGVWDTVYEGDQHMLTFVVMSNDNPATDIRIISQLKGVKVVVHNDVCLGTSTKVDFYCDPRFFDEPRYFEVQYLDTLCRRRKSYYVIDQGAFLQCDRRERHEVIEDVWQLVPSGP